LVTIPKNCWSRVLGSVVIQLYAGECTPSVDRAYRGAFCLPLRVAGGSLTQRPEKCQLRCLLAELTLVNK